MKNRYSYTIFKARPGYFGFCSTENGLYRTCLPTQSRLKTKKILTKGLKNPIFQKSLLPTLKNKIIAYYKGIYVDFSSEAIDLSEYTPFSQKILRACMKIRYGHTKTYKQLAASAGHPNSARAAGSVMAHNRLPLIIPCHRVIGSDDTLHGFSAPGGPKTKQKMLYIEYQTMVKLDKKKLK
jgi:methylated-DNA-[protein]-cysteine S-methyltransferase